MVPRDRPAPLRLNSNRVSLTGLRRGDVVEIDKKGRRFLATVNRVSKEGVEFQPHLPAIGYRSATAREVVGVWKATTATRREKGLTA